MKHAIAVNGIWNEGYALDKYVETSEYVGEDAFGHPMFHTTCRNCGVASTALSQNGRTNGPNALPDGISRITANANKNSSAQECGNHQHYSHHQIPSVNLFP